MTPVADRGRESAGESASIAARRDIGPDSRTGVLAWTSGLAALAAIAGVVSHVLATGLAAGALIGALIVLVRNADARRRLLREPILWAILAYLATRLWAWSWAPDRGASLHNLADALLVLTAIPSALGARTLDRRSLALAVTIVALVDGYACADYLLALHDRWHGITGGYVRLGVYHIWLSLLCWDVLRVPEPDRGTHRVARIGALVGAVGTAYSLARTLWLVLVAMGAEQLARYRSPVRAVLISLVVLGALIGVSSQFAERALTLSQPVSNASDRQFLYTCARERIAEKPWTGFGMDSFRQTFTYWDLVRDPRIDSWHNEGVQAYFEGGLPGLLGWLGLVLVPLVSYRSARAAMWRRALVWTWAIAMLNVLTGDPSLATALGWMIGQVAATSHSVLPEGLDPAA